MSAVSTPEPWRTTRGRAAATIAARRASGDMRGARSRVGAASPGTAVDASRACAVLVGMRLPSDGAHA